MISSFRALALISTFVLASCGGGGGGGSAAPGPTGPQGVVITETNAKPVAANALDAAQSTSATGGTTGLPIGVQVSVSGAAPADFRLIADTARFAARSFSAAALPTAVTVSQTVNCTVGGTATVSGHVASSSGLTAGDSLTLTMNNCSEDAGTSLSGTLAMTVVSGSLTSVPFHVVLATTATNLAVTSGGVTIISNGDVRLDWTATTTSETLVATGASMSTRTTVSGATRTTTLRNFTQAQTITGSTVSGTVSGTIETDSSRLGGTTVTYTITTPTPVVWDAVTGTATAGVVKVVGANNAQLLITINGDGSVTIQLDANGDGVFEKTITSTVAELATLT